MPIQLQHGLAFLYVSGDSIIIFFKFYIIYKAKVGKS
jgi:hypothetical protein